MLKIIGNGLIANAFRENMTNDNFEIFASGVSDSSETSDDEFQREIILLKSIDRDLTKTLIYFSTYSINDKTKKESKYIKHKLKMENIIKDMENTLIIRLANVIGKSGNPKTMFNFFKNKINNNEEITILKNAYRSIIDIDDVVCFVNNLPNNPPRELEFIHPIPYNIVDVVKMMSSYMNKEVSIKEVEGGDDYVGEPSDFVFDFFNQNNVNIHYTYIEKIFDKYL